MIRRTLSYAAFLTLVIGCRSAQIRGEEDGCEDGKIDAISIAGFDRDACVAPDPFRETYGLRGCGLVLRKEKFRDAHQVGWESCYPPAYEDVYPQSAFNPEACGVNDTGLDPGDTCTPAKVGPDVSQNTLVVLEQDLACSLEAVSQLVTSRAQYDALFACEAEAVPNEPQVDFSTQDAFVQYATFVSLGTSQGVYDDGESTYLLYEAACAVNPPPPPFRALRVTAVAKDTVIDEAISCRTSACE